MQRFRCGASSWGAAGRGRGGEAGGKKAWREAGGVRGGGGGQKGGWRRAEKKVRLGPRGSALRHAGPPSRNGGEEDEQGVGGGGERGKRGEEGKAEEEGARWPLWGTAVSLWRDRRGERGGGRFGNVRGCCFVGRGTTQQPAREEEKKCWLEGGGGARQWRTAGRGGRLRREQAAAHFIIRRGRKKGWARWSAAQSLAFAFLWGNRGGLEVGCGGVPEERGARAVVGVSMGCVVEIVARQPLKCQRSSSRSSGKAV